jgi:hypothetical protein
MHPERLSGFYKSMEKVVLTAAFSYALEKKGVKSRVWAEPRVLMLL